MLVEILPAFSDPPLVLKLSSRVLTSLGKTLQSHSGEVRNHFRTHYSHGENPQTRISEASMGAHILKSICEDFVRGLAPMMNHLIKT